MHFLLFPFGGKYTNDSVEVCSHDQKCAHNKVNGPMAIRFGLSCIRQKLVPFQALNWGLSFAGPCSVVALSDGIDPKIKG